MATTDDRRRTIILMTIPRHLMHSRTLITNIVILMSNPSTPIIALSTRIVISLANRPAVSNTALWRSLYRHSTHQSVVTRRLLSNWILMNISVFCMSRLHRALPDDAARRTPRARRRCRRSVSRPRAQSLRCCVLEQEKYYEPPSLPTRRPCKNYRP